MTKVHSNSVLLDTEVHALNLYDQDISCDCRDRKKVEYERSCVDPLNVFFQDPDGFSINLRSFITALSIIRI